ncbi:MAG: nucleoside deaminase [Vicinamibacterales bacterium]
MASRYAVDLPAWVIEEVAGAAIDSDEQKVALTCRLARRNVREGTGGPFAALVIDADAGALVSAGVNLVLASGLSSSHAEVVALSLAQVATGAWDLGAGGARRELVVNWRPCVQCFGAVLWSGVTRLVIAGQGPELERLTGFDEGPLVPDWIAQFEARGITVADGVLRDEALAVFAEYGELAAAGKVTVYNARSRGAIRPR